MKIAPLFHALQGSAVLVPRLIHTGQHSSNEMSQVFFDLFNLPKPEFSFAGVAGSQSQQIAQIMTFYDALVQSSRPDICVVVGDVTSSLACALVAAKQGIPLAHIEAGLRSRDRSMPEEINRLVIDALADILYTPSLDGDENLLMENRPRSAINMVGNIMIDSFEIMRKRIEEANVYEKFGQPMGSYGVVTFHRPANVDSAISLKLIVEQLVRVSRILPLIFPIHPRTKDRLREFGLEHLLVASDIVITEPLGYIEFMSLVLGSKVVITDSGGVQEETTYLGIPCLTARENTERPITISLGTNNLVNIGELLEQVEEILVKPIGTHKIPKFWDGKTAERIVNHMTDFLIKPPITQIIP
jgi:UDP-N-acetylglucosamine 2-epimerase (non-hydrolysing)